MSRPGQILLEVLVAAILLVVLIPHIPALCWKYAGPDWAAYSAMVAENNAQIYMNTQKAKLADLRAQLAALEAAKLKRGHDALVAEEPSAGSEIVGSLLRTPGHHSGEVRKGGEGQTESISERSNGL